MLKKDRSEQIGKSIKKIQETKIWISMKGFVKKKLPNKRYLIRTRNQMSKSKDSIIYSIVYQLKEDKKISINCIVSGKVIS